MWEKENEKTKMELEEEAKRNRQKYLDIIEESKRILEERRKGMSVVHIPFGYDPNRGCDYDKYVEIGRIFTGEMF